MKIISQEELRKCRRVMEVFRELFAQCGDTVAADIGEYGVVHLQYYYRGQFGCFEVHRDSEKMFQAFWDYYLQDRLLKIVRGTAAEELEYEEIWESLSPEQRHLLEKQKVELWEMAFLPTKLHT